MRMRMVLFPKTQPPPFSLHHPKISSDSSDGNFPNGGKTSQFAHPSRASLVNLCKDIIQFGHKVLAKDRAIHNDSKSGCGCNAFTISSSSVVSSNASAIHCTQNLVPNEGGCDSQLSLLLQPHLHLSIPQVFNAKSPFKLFQIF
ncbi:hypothetical protein M0R45_010312 [Rubus argutus]|uniref:Uncharacterized protein n=1 Tax=Rubus argutus TaxID=59490 RepID=A0AAW1YAH4_RUBAR